MEKLKNGSYLRMEIKFSDRGWEDYLHWQQYDKKILKRINELLKAIKRDPWEGIGKPEPLKFGLAGYWSRRIDEEHRLIYKIESNILSIAQCRYHY